MTDISVAEDGEETPKKGKKGLILGIVGALVFGGGGFYATYSSMILGPKAESEHVEDSHAEPVIGVTFVELEPLTISLGKFATSRHLRFRAFLEVEPDAAAEVENLAPRILDVFNTYLRAISESELEDPASMNRLRAQMLRRVQVVAGEGNVKDLLIAEFVLN